MRSVYCRSENEESCQKRSLRAFSSGVAHLNAREKYLFGFVASPVVQLQLNVFKRRAPVIMRTACLKHNEIHYAEPYCDNIELVLWNIIDISKLGYFPILAGNILHNLVIIPEIVIEYC